MEKQLLIMNNNNSDDAMKKKKKNKAAEEEKEEKEDANTLNGLLPPISPTTRIFWNSRKRSANGQRIQKENEDSPNGQRLKKENEDSPKTPTNKQEEESMIIDNAQEPSTAPVLSERRKALFEPLEPAHGMNSRLSSGEVLFPPPDFDAASYPKGWLIGKKRKLVNVDVVESMRRIAVQEMNRKDREINGLNEQLEEDARALEHLQVQLLQERSKRADVERENSLLQNQVSMLMNMIQEEEGGTDEGDGGGTDDS